MKEVAVMHLVDTLETGGAERVAVNLANALASDHWRVFLCTTRRDGPLARLVSDRVRRISLERRRRFDWRAVGRLAAVIREQQIDIVHAHSTAAFIAVAAARRARRAKVIWHAHNGRLTADWRLLAPYRLAAPFLSGVIAVTPALAEWSQRRLRIPARPIRYIPNFACESVAGPAPRGLPGVASSRVVQLANLRPQKDHGTMLRAMACIREQMPESHLLLVGGPDRGDSCSLRRMAAEMGLEHNVTFLGERDDAGAILRECSVGVLSSSTEGLPLALLEYGLAGLAAVATAVGQCPDVLEQGQCGLLVPPGSAAALADAVLSLLGSPDRRAVLGAKLQARVRRLYSPEAILSQVCRFYEEVLAAR